MLAGGCAARPGIATAAGRAVAPWDAASNRRAAAGVRILSAARTEACEARRRTCAQRLTGGRSAASRSERSELRESAGTAC